MPTLVTRDPFARAELVRSQHYTHDTCAWCGSNRQTRTGRPFLYQYRWRSDDDQYYRDDRRDNRFYCSVSCFRCFNW